MPRNTLRLTTDQRLTQKLSPMQLRYFRILEMPETRVEEEVRRELDANPALEVAENAPATGADDPADTAAPGIDGEDGPAFDETAEEMQLADYRTEDDVPAYRLEARNHQGGDRYAEPMAVAPESTLMDTLLDQLALAGLSETDEAIGRYIIGNIDDNGYLTRTPDVMADDMSAVAGRDIEPADVRRVLATVRTFDPAGVGAVDLRECLLLQLRRMPPSPAADNAREIITHYFDLFSKKHYQRLMATAGIDRDSLNGAIDLIRTLNPKPGSDYGNDDATYRLTHVTPDFSVEPGPEGDLTVTLLSNIPELSVERTFAAGAAPAVAGRRRERHAEAADAFIRRQRDEAQEFITILRNRAATLDRIMTAIVSIQRRFFTTGSEADLRPMILKDISNLTGDDPSTVSRATANKYVSTPWGIFPLKYFFNEQFSADDPETSSRAIIAALREIIDGEDRSHPLSDAALAARLAERGLNVARRTVTKYREQLDIPVARLRRDI